MLKHANPRSSPSLSLCNTSLNINSVDSTHSNLQFQNEFIDSLSAPSQGTQQKASSFGVFNERSVDCNGIVSQEPLKKVALHGGEVFDSLFERKLLNLGSVSGNGIGPVITHGKAIVRRGLSFNGKKEPDSSSIRSVKSEGQCVVKSETQNYNLPTKVSSEVSLEPETTLESVKGYPNNLITSNSSSATNNETDCKDPFNIAILNCVSLKNNKHDNVATTQSNLPKKTFGLSKVGHPSLKSLLRLPGVYGHIPVPEGAATGSPHILNPDSLSLNSANSFLSSNSGRASSRSWDSNASSNSNNTSDSCNSNASSSSSELTSTTLKVFSKCLRSDIEYKTVNIGSKVTSRQLINLLLSKARMRHRDSNLFYLTMEVTVRRWTGVPVRALLVLEDGARPAQLALCHPSGDLRFVLQMRKGGVIKVHDTVLMPGSQYKSLLISYCTNAEETVQLLLNCCGRRESKHYFALHEVCQTPHYKDRRIISSERPLEVKADWPKDIKAEYVFVIRRNMSQALSLRKLSTLAMKPNDDEDNYLRKESPNIGNLTLKGNSIVSKGRIRGRSLSPARPQSNLGAVIDCTRTTPVIMIMKSQSLQSESESNNKSIYRENKQTWSIVHNDEAKIGGKILSKFDITYPTNYNKRDTIKTQLLNSQQGVPTNSIPVDRRYSTNSPPKCPMEINLIQSIPISNIHQSKFITANKLSSDLTTKQDKINNEKLSILSKIQQEKFTKALEKLNPHIIDEKTDESCWSNHKDSHNLLRTYFSIPTKYSNNFYSDLKTQDLKLSENQRCLIESEFVAKNNTSTNSGCLDKSYLHEKSSNNSVSKTSVLSSAVQTELTCLPSKWLSNKKHKWNSVETLMDFQSSVRSDPMKVESFKNNFQVNNNLPISVKDEETEHQPGIRCEHNCKKCFYI